MSHLVARIMLAIFMLPLAAVVYVATFVANEDMLGSLGSGYRTGESVMFTFAGGVTWAFVAVYWFLLWRKSVVWTGIRRINTLLVAAGLLLLGVVVTSFAYLSAGSTALTCLVFSTVLIPLLWLTATVFIWRESALERADRLRAAGRSGVACPVCGYNLTGLTQSRCPECGCAFTLDELLCAQPVTPGTEME